MKDFAFIILILVGLMTTGFIAWRQQIEIDRTSALVQNSESAEAQFRANATPNTEQDKRIGPSLETLRMRGAVSLLRVQIRDLDNNSQPKPAIANEWSQLQGKKPSEHADFINLTDAQSVDLSTPDLAVQSYHRRTLTQGSEPLSASLMVEFLELPGDFVEHAASYAIDLGEGISTGTIGYRVAATETISERETRLTLEYEHSTGGSYERELFLVKRNGIWKVKPTEVTKIFKKP